MKISIITATYNCEKSLQRTIDSVASQDYEEIEHIIIDGGSSDNTLNIIQANSDRITKYISEKDSGIYDALNKGIRLATGDVIGFLNSDDTFADQHIISAIANCFKTEKTDLVYGNLVYQTVDDSNEKTIRYWESNNFNTESLKYGWMPPHPTLYCKREIYEQWGLFNDKFKIAADYDFILRIFKQPTIKKTFLPIILVKMSIGGISNNSIKNIIRKSFEDYKAIKNNMIGGFLTLLLKNARKIAQFNNLKNSKIKC